ncbi:putative effector protein [Aphelenchoides besseyi]|nr:putative effector protein [Aphelenchoides besseyi]KAI6209271.1 putative effector protein [Aphelenchoides besseyi]
MTMHPFTKIVVLSLTALSILEVFSDPYGSSEKHVEEEHDAFREFDDPADKYTGHEHEEPLEIRAPSDHGNSAPKSFIPPMDMPPIRFAYCVSCGYRNAFEQFSNVIREKYPTVQIEGSNYSPGPAKAILAQVLGFAKIALIIAIVFERNPFTILGMQTPSVYNWMLTNKLSACLMLFMFSNSLESMLMSTGAFEIYIGNERIWSKLESGRVPSPSELMQAIDGHLAVQGVKTGGDFGGFEG